MLRKLPPTVTADQTPDWLPPGWLVHSTSLKRGRQTKTYTELSTGKKFYTKDQVVDYIEMEKIREKRESDIEKKKASLKAYKDRLAEKERPPWLPDDWEMKHTINFYGGNPYTMYVHKSTGFRTILKSEVLSLRKTMDFQDSSSGGEKEETIAARERPAWLPDDWEMEHRIGSYTMYVHKSTGFKTYLKEQVLSVHNTMDQDKDQDHTQASSSGGEEEEEATCNEIAYVIDESEEDLSESEYFEKNVADFSTPIRSQPERMQKLESRAKTQCVFEDEDMSSDDKEEEKLREAEISKEENALGQTRVVSNLEEDQNLHDVVVECDDNAKGLTGGFNIEINVEHEPANDGLVKKDPNKSVTEGIGTREIEIINIESDSDSSEVVEVKNQKSEESLKVQSAAQEVIGNEARRSVLFQEEAPSKSFLVFDNNSNARSSADDNINTINELGLSNPCTEEEEKINSSKKRKYNKKKKSEEPHTPPSKNIKTKKKKKSEEPCSPLSKNIKTKKRKSEEPCSSPSKNIKKKKGIEKPTEKRKGKRPQREKGSPIDWPELNPNFVFEPIRNRFCFLEDDSVIREYLEKNFTSDGNLPLLDFGLPSFADIKISKDDEEEHEAKRKKSSLDPPPPPTPCVQFASSSLPSCSYMQHTVAGN